MELRSNGRVSPERLYWNYVIATAVGAVMIVTGYSISVLAARQGVFDEEAINVSGMQRMLSQRTMLLARRLSSTGNDYYYHLLVDTIDQFDDNHQWLLDRLDEGTPLWDHYHSESGAALDRGSRNLIAQMRQIVAQYEATGILPLDQLQALEDVAIVDLLADLNQSVAMFEASANDRNALLRLLEFAAAALVIAILLIKAFLIFRPAHKQLTKTISRLRLQAEIDPLTGLANRRYFIARSRELIEGDAPSNERIFLLALDLDGFKTINDSLGHPAGDVVLRTVSSELKRTVAGDDAIEDSIIARPGGDEFLLICAIRKGSIEDVARNLTSTIIEAIERPIHVPVEAGISTDCSVGVSIGIAYAQEVGGNVDHLVANGDIALYESKRAGKGIATAFDRSMREDAEKRHHWTTEVARGLKELEFKTFFQPQISLQSGHVLGFEAQARWLHPKLGLIEPAKFLTQLQDSNRTDALDGQIILGAVEMLQWCRGQGLGIEHMSINASGALLRDPEIAGMLIDLVEVYGLAPEDFIVEFVESILVDSGEDEALASVQRLKSAGFKIAVDNFGTGFSSLESVVMLGCDVLKIDRSLIRRLGDQRVDKVVRAAVSMAHSLDARVYAEGVETEAQLRWLTEWGVDVCQGHLVSKSLSGEALETWLAELPVDAARGPTSRLPLWRPPTDKVDQKVA